MNHKTYILIAITLTSGCTTTSLEKMDVTSSKKLNSKTVTVVSNPEPDFDLPFISNIRNEETAMLILSGVLLVAAGASMSGQNVSDVSNVAATSYSPSADYSNAVYDRLGNELLAASDITSPVIDIQKQITKNLSDTYFANIYFSDSPVEAHFDEYGLWKIIAGDDVVIAANTYVWALVLLGPYEQLLPWPNPETWAEVTALVDKRLEAIE